jgi:methionyl-tRNA formyltransferase
MRIVLIGQAAFGEKVLEAVLAASEEVVGVFCPPDVSGKPNGLRQLAERHHIPAYQPGRMRDPEVFETFQQLQPDLNVMAFVTDLVPERILNLPRCGSIQYHPSLLPRHRGGSAISWAIIQGDSKTGLTIFWPDRGIDTGSILLQREVEIAADDTTGSLYFNKLFPLGVEALVEAIKMVKDGTAPRIVQDETLATYEPLCTEAQARIDWSQPVDTVYNLIRGCNPQPGANTTWRGHSLKIFDCQRQRLPQIMTPGEVTGIAADSFQVAARDGVILIRRVQLEGQAKIKAAEFIAVSGLKIGDGLNT